MRERVITNFSMWRKKKRNRGEKSLRPPKGIGKIGTERSGGAPNLFRRKV